MYHAYRETPLATGMATAVKVIKVGIMQHMLSFQANVHSQLICKCSHSTAYLEAGGQAVKVDLGSL